ncbi:MAG: recombinase family protein [Xanthobacteraceae bacterium]
MSISPTRLGRTQSSIQLRNPHRSCCPLLPASAQKNSRACGPSHGRLMLTILGSLAEFERELIRARTGEGRKRAQAHGLKFGGPRSSMRTNA